MIYENVRLKFITKFNILDWGVSVNISMLKSPIIIVDQFENILFVNLI